MELQASINANYILKTSKGENTKQLFDVVIDSKRGLLDLDVQAIWRYRDLLRMFVYRDFVTYYKQTILGPLWFFIQPVFAAAVNLFVFGGLAGLGPEGVPGFLFYLSGPILWQYFQDTFLKTSATFTENQAIFGKVYFPRLIMPITVLVSGLLKFAVQFGLLWIAIFYVYIDGGYVGLRWEALYFPVVLLLIMVLSMGFGLIVAALTTKYRDIKFFIDFFIPLLKYVTPGIATSKALFLERLPPNLVSVAKGNPMGTLIDAFNYMFVGAGSFSWVDLGGTALIAFFILLVGVLVFNQTERTFMDTV